MQANQGPLLILGLLAGIPVSPAAEAPVEGNLEEIVVTAQKRSENLQDVPIAITAVSGQALDRAGATGPCRRPRC